MEWAVPRARTASDSPVRPPQNPVKRAARTHQDRVDALRQGSPTLKKPLRFAYGRARDVVVLAWDSVLSGAADIHDGHNVVLHEFAHQLDQECSVGDGVPVLPRRSMYVAWARVLGHDFDQLVRDAEHHHRTLIDQYGATNPAEFFAVATETFFEKPRQLRVKHPELYSQLQQFYRQDPAALDTR